MSRTLLQRARLQAIITASLAGLLFGFDTALISGVTQDLRLTFALSPAWLGGVVSAALWGTLLGASALGRPGDRLGSRDMLKWIAALYVVGAAGSALAWDLPSLLLFRFLTGIAIGGSSVVAPVYIAEVAPASRRGALVGLFQVNIVTGILLAYVSNFLVALAVTGPDLWRWKLAVAAPPALLLLVLLWGVPHSPRWLLSRGRVPEARSSLERLGEAEPGAALAELQAGLAAAAEPAGQLSWQRHHRPIMLAVGLALFNQLSGINAILYYLGDIFAAAGFSAYSASLQSMVIGATNLLATLAAMTLIDRAGRKTLLVLGSVLTALALAGVGAVMASGRGEALLLPLLILFIAAFALSQGAVIWVYLSEIFPATVRARGQSLGSATHWVMNALLSLGFPAIASLSRSVPFVFFSAMMLLQLFLVLRYLPETKGTSLERLALAIKDGARQRT
jgi:sugar porter (SP) family MFS transporter